MKLAAARRAPDKRGLRIPFVRMGKVSSDDLFEAREQVLFDFYERNAGRYATALDVGANVGIHALLMAQAGWQVRAFEPDPRHHAELVRNVAEHGLVASIAAVQAAVSTAAGGADFVRVLDNGTASHLAGARDAYGPTEVIRVLTLDCRPLFDWADLAKIDVEGHEAALLATVTARQRCEFLVEVGSRANADAIYAHFAGARAMWVHRGGRSWEPVRAAKDVPGHYKEGTLFIGEKP